MATVLVIERHTAADCPVGNEKALKANNAIMAKMPELMKKYGIKPIGMWIVHSEHMGVYAYDVPSMDAVNGLEQEPEMMAWRCFATAEYKLAVPMEEVKKLMVAMTIKVNSK